MNYEVLLSQCTFREAREYIRKRCREVHEVAPGYRIADIHLIGVPPLLVGVDGDTIVFPYTKPCHGTFVIRAGSGEEAARLRSAKKKR